MIQRGLAFVLAAALASTAAAIDHTDIFVFDDGGALQTGGFECPTVLCSTGNETEQRVFSQILNSFNGSDQPGFRALGGDLPSDIDIFWDFLPITVDTGPHAGHTSTLLYWDGVGPEAEFGPPPTDHIVGYFGRDNLSAIADGGDEMVPGEIAFKATGAGATHTHGYLAVDIDGDFNTIESIDSGIYLLSWQLRGAGLATTDPIFLLFRTLELELATPLTIAEAWVESRVDTLFIDGLPGDFNGDGLVNAADYTQWRGGLGAGAFGPNQYNVWAANLGDTAAPPAASVPEPSAALLVAFAASAVARRRREARRIEPCR